MKAKSFDKAFEELQAIVHQLQSEEMGIDNLSTQLKKADELVKFCKEKLRSVEADIQKINPIQNAED
jgi:exodeoxyribonuclease VII small subunit